MQYFCQHTYYTNNRFRMSVSEHVPYDSIHSNIWKPLLGRQTHGHQTQKPGISSSCLRTGQHRWAINNSVIKQYKVVTGNNKH
jgi:hypothetical protein